MKINVIKSSTVLFFWLMNGLIFAQVDIIPAGNWFTNAQGYTIIVDGLTYEVADIDYIDLLTRNDAQKVQGTATNGWRLPKMDEFIAMQDQLFAKGKGNFHLGNEKYEKKYSEGYGIFYDYVGGSYWPYETFKDFWAWSFEENGPYKDPKFGWWYQRTNGDDVYICRRLRFIRLKTSTQSSEKALQDELTKIKAYQNLLAKEAQEKEAIREKEAEEGREWLDLHHSHIFNYTGIGFNNFLSENSPAVNAITLFHKDVWPINYNLTFDFEFKIQKGLGTNESWISKTYAAPIDSFKVKGNGGGSLSVNLGFSVLPVNNKNFSITLTPFLGLDIIKYPTVEISSIDKTYDDTDVPIVYFAYGCSFNMRIGRNLLLKTAYCNNFTKSIPINITTSNLYSITTSTYQVPVDFSSFLFGIAYCKYLN